MTDFQTDPVTVAVPEVRAESEGGQACPVSEAEAWAEGMVLRNLSAWYGSFQAVKDVNLLVGPKRVTAVIGPSGCGKSTLIRCLNRMHEVAPKARVAGQVYLRSEDIYGNGADPVLVRRTKNPLSRRPAATLSKTDIVGKGFGFWKTMPTRRRTSTGSAPFP
jgi:ABC-type dipeptide/oligopeptide/nickel transport system ATPase component